MIKSHLLNRREGSERAGSECLGPRASRPHSSHKSWHSRGHLPHFDGPGLTQSITFGLNDSLPLKVVEGWKEELAWRDGLPAGDPRSVKLRKRIARYEDGGHGACWLARDDIADLVENALLHFDGTRYSLLAWCIMPNHVHALIATIEGHPLDQIVHSWKSFTSKQANRLLARQGEFWRADYHDRFIRDATHLAAAIAYIERNPVSAGLVEIAGDWPFASAVRRPE